MGSSSSGNYGGRRTVSGSLQIDLNRLIREGCLAPGKAVAGSITWDQSSIGFKANMVDVADSYVRLTYMVTSDGRSREVDLKVRLTTTPQHFGGRRWWFVCPHSGRRVSKLYLPPGSAQFSSRVTHRLAYRSQRLFPADRRTERMFRLRRQLGDDGGLGSFVRKPPRMHQTTFERKMAQIAVTEHAICLDLKQFLGRIGHAI